MPLQHRPRAQALSRGGLATRARLVGAGLHPGLGDRLVAAGEWTRLAPSTYLTGVLPPTDAQLVAAAREHAGKDAVVTGAVVCRELGVADVPEERVVEVLLPAGRRVTGSPFVVVHQTERMPSTWVRGGVPYADAARALVDCARRVQDLQSVRAVLLGAVCAGHGDVASLHAEVAAGQSAGSAVLRRVVADAAAGAWSAPEAEAADLVAVAVAQGRLPPFVLNRQLRVAGRLVGRPDGYLPGTGVAWQVDSHRHHADEQGLEETLAVHDAFAAAGLQVLHVTPRRLRAAGPAWVEQLVAAVQHGAEPSELQVGPR